MRVAVVGGGVSGLGAVWLLNEHSEHQVDLFESNGYVGGHTHTVQFERTPSLSCPVDTGFIVFNHATYPNFLNFLKFLRIDHIPSNMSFSVKRTSGPSLEWSGNGLRSLFMGISTWNDWFSQSRMLWDIVRFNFLAVDVLSLSDQEDLSVGEYLAKHKYSDAFKKNYLLPMVSSIWSTPANKTALTFPMRTLVRFMSNHHLLQIFNQPQWLTIKNGSKTYVDRILCRLNPSQCFKNTRIDSISIDSSAKISLKDTLGRCFGPYDHVIFGSHADQTSSILKKSGHHELLREQLDILSQFQFNQNQAVLHNDVSLMPLNRQVWTSWNYMITQPPPLCNDDSSSTLKVKHQTSKSYDCASVEHTVSLTYWMNLLQSIPASKYGHVLVTLNPPQPIDSRFVFGSWRYDHPQYTAQSVRAQKQLTTIQGKHGLSFVGAWTNYGFHEDGFTSALKLLVQEKPEVFKVDSPIDLIIKDEKVAPATRVVRLLLGIIQFLIEMLVLVWSLRPDLTETLRLKSQIH